MHCSWKFPTNRKMLKIKLQDKEKARADGNLDIQWTECPPWKCFLCGSVDYLISKFPKPPKNNNKWRKNVRFRGDIASQK